MDTIYRDNIIDHYKNPRNFGDLSDANVVAREANASCGDMLQLALKLQVTSNKQQEITDVKFKSIGCAISTAAGSLLTEAILGKTVEELKQLTDRDIVGLLGIEVSPTRMKCATLPLRALQKALRLPRFHSGQVRSG